MRNLDGDIAQAQEDASASERARRAAENERDELQEEISNVNSKAYVRPRFCPSLLLTVVLVTCLLGDFL